MNARLYRYTVYRFILGMYGYSLAIYSRSKQRKTRVVSKAMDMVDTRSMEAATEAETGGKKSVISLGYMCTSFHMVWRSTGPSNKTTLCHPSRLCWGQGDHLWASSESSKQPPAGHRWCSLLATHMQDPEDSVGRGRRFHRGGSVSKKGRGEK